MNIVFERIELSMQLHSNQCNSIVIEDSSLFESIIVDLYRTINKQNEKIFIYDNAEKLDADKLCELITSPLDLFYNKKTIQKKVILELENEIRIAGLEDEIMLLYGKIIEKIDQMRISVDYDITFDVSKDMTGILKDINISINDPEGTFVEKTIDFFATMHRLFGKQVFILANCDSFFSDNDYTSLEKWMRNEEVVILFVRGKQTQISIQQNEYIIDKDFCIIND